MSEPIQSIAQNNYILHNIDAKKLYVQEPLFTANSGDAVYVGWRPDETVLYEGSGQFGINLSDSIYNYDKIAVTVSRVSPISEQYFYTKDISASGGYFNTTYISMALPGSTADMYLFTTPWTVLNNGNTISAANNSFGATLNLTANKLHYYSKNSTGPISRIVGINRKENV